MCGRFAQKTDVRNLARQFAVAETPAAEARYNVAPAQAVPCVRERGGGREMNFFKWVARALVRERYLYGRAPYQRAQPFKA